MLPHKITIGLFVDIFVPLAGLNCEFKTRTTAGQFIQSLLCVCILVSLTSFSLQVYIQGRKNWMRCLGQAIFIIWGITIVYWALIALNVGLQTISLVPSCESEKDTIAGLNRRVNEDTIEMKRLISEFHKRFGNKPDLYESPILQSRVTTGHLGSTHEPIRRRAVHFVREMRYTASSQLRTIRKIIEEPSDKKQDILSLVDALKAQLEEITQYIEADLDNLGKVDVTNSRSRELDRVAQVLQGRLDRLQNPPNCDSARLLIVSLNRPCAFGCNVHHLAYCFQLAYASGRTMVFASSGSTYDKWWSEHFLPLSKTCGKLVQMRDSNIPAYESESQPNRVVSCPYIGSMQYNKESLPPAVPVDVATNLTSLHGAPFVWFIGHLTAYLMRPTLRFEQQINDTLLSYNLSLLNRSPVVGIHVRRTDKINTEAAFHGIEEYLTHAERRFAYWDAKEILSSQKVSPSISPSAVQKQPNSTQIAPIKRQALIATDEPTVLNDARKSAPHYTFLGDSKRAQSAGLGQRTSSDSITGIALDIILLSKTDYLVCTFSSQVCRVAYELMQTRHSALGDASALVQSLDDIYYFGGQQSAPYTTIIDHKPLHLKPGDLVHMNGNHWDGFANVRPVMQTSDALAPAFKFQPSVLVIPMGPKDQTRDIV